MINVSGLHSLDMKAAVLSPVGNGTGDCRQHFRGETERSMSSIQFCYKALRALRAHSTKHPGVVNVPLFVLAQ